MSFRDFCAHYSRLEIVNLDPDSLEDDSEGKKKWEVSNFEGNWVKGATSGGCRNHLGNSNWIHDFFFFQLKVTDSLFIILLSNHSYVSSESSISNHTGRS